MTPILPERWPAELREEAIRLIEADRALGRSIPRATGQAVAHMLRYMTSYYTNTMEGVRTYPLEIEAAMEALPRQGSDGERSKHLALATLTARDAVHARLLAEGDACRVSEPKVLRWIHERLFREVPEDLRQTQTISGNPGETIVPGQWRTSELTVGVHQPPLATILDECLEQIHKALRAFERSQTDQVDRVLAALAAHHRYAWVHPSPDGNGRLARLITDGQLYQVGIDHHGLWSLDRGLGRDKAGYDRALQAADQVRRGDTDGRGQLSQGAYLSWTAYAVRLACDQVGFMADVLQLEAVPRRIQEWARLQAARDGTLHERAGDLLEMLFLKGELSRSQAARVLGVTERHARDVIRDLEQRAVLTTSPRAPLRPKYPQRMAAVVFPGLYPAEVEERMAADSHVKFGPKPGEAPR